MEQASRMSEKEMSALLVEDTGEGNAAACDLRSPPAPPPPPDPHATFVRLLKLAEERVIALTRQAQALATIVRLLKLAEEQRIALAREAQAQPVHSTPPAPEPAPRAPAPAPPPRAPTPPAPAPAAAPAPWSPATTSAALVALTAPPSVINMSKIREGVREDTSAAEADAHATVVRLLKLPEERRLALARSPSPARSFGPARTGACSPGPGMRATPSCSRASLGFGHRQRRHLSRGFRRGPGQGVVDACERRSIPPPLGGKVGPPSAAISARLPPWPWPAISASSASAQRQRGDVDVERGGGFHRHRGGEVHRCSQPYRSGCAACGCGAKTTEARS